MNKYELAIEISNVWFLFFQFTFLPITAGAVIESNSLTWAESFTYQHYIQIGIKVAGQWYFSTISQLAGPIYVLSNII